MKSEAKRTSITSQECLKENLIPYSKIIYYMCHIVYDKYPMCRFPLYLLLKCLKRIIRRTTFDIEIVPAEYIKRLTFSSKFIDVNNCVIINSTFFKYVFNASQYIKFGECHRIAQAIPGLNPPHTILISETLNSNFKNKLKAKIVPVNGKVIKIASLVDISLISSPTAVSNLATDQMLKLYFNTPKLLYKDDLILVDLKDYGSEFYYTNLKLNQIDSISFKCNKIEEGGIVDCLWGYFCVTGGTTLKQSMDTQEFLPKKSKILTKSDDPMDCLLEICPKGLQKYVNQLETAIRPFILIKKINLMPNFLMQGGKGSGKNLILSSLAAKMGLKLCRLSTHELNANAYAQTEVKMRNAFFRAKVSAPCIVSIEHFEDVCRNNEGQYDPRILHYFRNEVATLLGHNELPVILVCVSNSRDLPSETSKLFLETVNVEAPNQSERSEILQWIVRKKSICTEVDLATIASKTHGFLFEDLQTLVYHSEKKSIFDDRDVTLEDFDYALDIMQSSYTESLGAPKVPKVRWSDVGGLDDVKREIIKTITLPLKQSKLWKSSGLKRSGLLLYGPPGTGKTLMAKAVATECGLCFLSVKGPELLNMYVGQSEKNVREVFEKARQASPCIIFFDELDSLAPNRGISGDSGGVMDRVVSQLLAEMDGLNENGTLFVIGATNRPDLIDPALLRPGRFDKLLYVGPCTDVPSKIGVLQALTTKFNLCTNVHLKKVVEMCPIYITGADLYGVCSDAWNSAAHRLIESKCNNLENLSEKDVIVTMDDFKCAINKAKPSVSRQDLVYYENLEQELSAKK